MSLSEKEIQKAATLVAKVHLDDDIEFMTTIETLEGEEIEATEEEIEDIHNRANEIISKLYRQI